MGALGVVVVVKPVRRRRTGLTSVRKRGGRDARAAGWPTASAGAPPPIYGGEGFASRGGGARAGGGHARGSAGPRAGPAGGPRKCERDEVGAWDVGLLSRSASTPRLEFSGGLS
ncbi:hypothetical protein NL676_031281 [Syzygium grande]|nr:hypothetical protein NL676_031281 [Syzygium grande]